MNPEEKDLLDSGLENSTRETSAQVQLGPGTQNPKELPNKASFTGGSKECTKNSRTDKNDVLNEGYTRHIDRIPSTTRGAEPPRDAKDSGSARPHSTHPETSSTNRP